jgi:hypothetical protein
MVKVKETFFKTKYRPADMLHNVDAMIYFKLNYNSNLEIIKITSI